MSYYDPELGNMVGQTPACESCEKICNSTKYRIDPFIEEIRGKQEWTWMCDKCYKEACADI